MQKKTFFTYALAIAAILILSGAAVTGAVAASSKADECDDFPRSVGRPELCLCSAAAVRRPALRAVLDATDLSRPYGYRSSCANPASSDPSLDPTYNPEW